MQYADPFALFELRRQRRDEERLALRKRLAELDAEGTEDATAIRVLRQVYSAADKTLRDGKIVHGGQRAAPTNVSPPAPAEKMSNKELCIAVLRDAAPNGMTAAQIKSKALLKYRRVINPNTLTVSLVRASKSRNGNQAEVRCEGRTWFYISQPDVPNVLPAALDLDERARLAEKEKPGIAPGQ